MKVRFKKLTPDAVIPTKAHPSDAGFDLVATSEEFKDGVYVYGTGIAMEIPEGYVGLVFPRSSIAKKDLFLSNSVGVIDSHYRGEVMFKFRMARAAEYVKDPIYSVGDRIGQIIIVPFPEIEFDEADALSDTDRGEGGYGSTGK